MEIPRLPLSFPYFFIAEALLPFDEELVGIRTGKYRLGTDQFLTNDEGESFISLEDDAFALLDEIGPLTYELIEPVCWLRVVSVGQNRPVRTPHAVSCSLPIPQRKSTISSIDSFIFT
jgi:hypothetical protein